MFARRGDRAGWCQELAASRGSAASSVRMVSEIDSAGAEILNRLAPRRASRSGVSRGATQLRASMVHWLGFDMADIDVAHADRLAGKSSYGSASRLAPPRRCSRRPKPLRSRSRSARAAGAAFTALHLPGDPQALGGYASRAGRASSCPSGSSAACSSNLGILGLYLGKIFDETRRRPLYIVKDALNLPPRDQVGAPDDPARARIPCRRKGPLWYESRARFHEQEHLQVMTRTEFYGLLDEITEAAPGTVKGAEALRDLTASFEDSLALVSFIAVVDERFGVTLSAPPSSRSADRGRPRRAAPTPLTA